MGNSNDSGKMAGHLGALLVTVGVISFMVGIFGGPRWAAFAGVAMMAVSLAAFFIEESAQRRAERRTS